MFIESTISKRYLIAPEERNVLDSPLIPETLRSAGALIGVNSGSINIWLLWSQDWLRLKARVSLSFVFTAAWGGHTSIRLRYVLDEVTRLYRQVAILKQRLRLKNGIT